MKNRKVYLLAALLIFMCVILTACTEAEQATRLVQSQADSFNVTRRLVVVNTRTDTVLYEVIGVFSLSNSQHGELQITSQIGENKYKLDYIYLSENITYIVQDVSDQYTDPYHYEFNILPIWGKIER